VNAMGSNAATNNSGSNVNAFGYNAAQNNSGDYVNAIGNTAASYNTGSNVNAIGYVTGANNTGSHVNAFGYSAAYNNSGDYVNAIGITAAAYNTGSNVNAIGYATGLNNSGSFVNAFGFSVAQNNTCDYVNAIGDYAASYNTGSHVNAIGSYSASNNAGLFVNSFGTNAALSNNGDYVNAIGYFTAYQNTGSNVNAIGYQAAYSNTGNNCTFIGSNNTTGTPNTLNNKFIVYGLSPTSPFIYGDTSNNQLSIGTSNLSANLTISGSFFATGSIYDSSYSSGISGQILSSTGSGTQWITGGSGSAATITVLDTSTNFATQTITSFTPTVTGVYNIQMTLTYNNVFAPGSGSYAALAYNFVTIASIALDNAPLPVSSGVTNTLVISKMIQLTSGVTPGFAIENIGPNTGSACGWEVSAIGPF
jgi:hypothetical protein